MEACSAISGAQLAWLSTNDVGGRSGKEVKRLLAAKIGVPRFRQRLFVEDGSEFLDDKILAAVPEKVQVVLLEFVQRTGAADPEMLAACRRNDTAALEQFLQLPSDPNLTDQCRRAPLHHAAVNGHVQPMQLLLEAGAKKDSRDIEGATALWMAAFRGQRDAVYLLIQAGANCTRAVGRDGAGLTPLHVAAKGGHLEVVRLLIEAGADCNQGGIDSGATPWAPLYVTDTGTPLYVAAEKGHLEVDRYLVEASADWNRGRSDTGATPLYAAAEKGHLEVVRYLVEASAARSPALNQRVNPFGTSPVSVAAQYGHLEVVRLLIEAGADYNQARLDGTTPKLVAIHSGHFQVARLLEAPPAVSARRVRTQARAVPGAEASPKALKDVTWGLFGLIFIVFFASGIFMNVIQSHQTP